VSGMSNKAAGFNRKDFIQIKNLADNKFGLKGLADMAGVGNYLISDVKKD
jgi:hypothetical protein